MDAPTITLHMAASLDGYITSPDGSYRWMESPDHFGPGATIDGDEIAEFLQGIDAYVMGSRTYEQAMKLGWVYGNKPVIVLSSRTLPQHRETVEFYDGPLQQLVNEQLAPRYKNVWLVGGSETAKAFLLENLVDEIVISVLPVLLGGGIPFFDQIGKQQTLRLQDVRPYRDGTVEMTYWVVKE